MLQTPNFVLFCLPIFDENINYYIHLIKNNNKYVGNVFIILYKFIYSFLKHATWTSGLHCFNFKGEH